MYRAALPSLRVGRLYFPGGVGRTRHVIIVSYLVAVTQSYSYRWNPRCSFWNNAANAVSGVFRRSRQVLYMCLHDKRAGRPSRRECSTGMPDVCLEATSMHHLEVPRGESSIAGARLGPRRRSAMLRARDLGTTNGSI